MANKCKIDRLSALPDNILTCNIFSRLSLMQIVRTSVLSSRWRLLWTQIPSLDFDGDIFESPEEGNLMGRKVGYINDIIDNILLLHSGHIQRFSFHLTLKPNQWKGLRLEEWIHCAALKKVKHMSLRSYFLIMDIPSSLFSCHLLRALQLDKFKFRGIPTEFHGFRSLQSCSLSRLDDLTDDGLKQLLGLCPLLHKLVLERCGQLINLEIQAPNLNFLSIDCCYYMESLTADCQLLVELEIKDCQRLIEFRMNSLRELSVKACPRGSGLTFLATHGCFRNLEEHIQIPEEQESAKGEVVADSTFPMLKKAFVEVSSAMKKEEAAMVAFLLNNAPSLNTMALTLPHCPANSHGKDFKNKVIDLQQIYEKVDIKMETHEWRVDAICLKSHKYNHYDISLF